MLTLKNFIKRTATKLNKILFFGILIKTVLCFGGELSQNKIPHSKIPLSELQVKGSEKILIDKLNSIRANTTVKGILLTGADISFERGSLIVPVKLWTLDEANKPDGGVIMGYAHGDLSSSRMYIRLDQLTLLESDGTFETVKIEGYVTETDGTLGIQGHLLDNSRRRAKHFLPLLRVKPHKLVNIIFTKSPTF